MDDRRNRRRYPLHVKNGKQNSKYEQDLQLSYLEQYLFLSRASHLELSDSGRIKLVQQVRVVQIRSLSGCRAQYSHDPQPITTLRTFSTERGDAGTRNHV